MKKLFLLLNLMTLSLVAQTTSTALKAQIDTQITNKTGANSITKTDVGNNIKAVVDYATEQSALKENVSNKSTNITTDAASDLKYPSVKAVKDYVDSNPKESYKVYTAILNQSSTDNPTVTVLKNTLGGTIVWTRFGIGSYKATLSNAFTANKTFLSSSMAATGNDIFSGSPSYDPSEVYFFRYHVVSNGYLDGLINAFVEIRVYN